jgi:dihydrofolate reductase
VLAGRGWYEVASADEGGAVAGIYGGAWSGPVLVLTHHPERLASDPTVEAVSDLESALARAEELAAGQAVSIFGADVARQVLALGRIDEIVVQIVPVLLGDGVRLFGEAPASRVRLERMYFGTSGMLTDIRFRVAGPPDTRVHDTEVTT